MHCLTQVTLDEDLVWSESKVGEAVYASSQAVCLQALLCNYASIQPVPKHQLKSVKLAHVHGQMCIICKPADVHDRWCRDATSNGTPDPLPLRGTRCKATPHILGESKSGYL